MIVQTTTVARNAFVESLRQPVFFVIVALSGLAQVFNTWNTGFSMGISGSGEVFGDNKLLLDIGLGTIFVCGVLLAAFVATAVVSREIENKTVLTVISKPIPRLAVILGKFLGVSLSILGAVVIMLGFLLLALRHGVLSTAADDPDQPVIVFGLLAVAISLGVALWGNFFYGWFFTQTALVVLFPAVILAWVLTLFVGKEWKLQPLTSDLRPQILTACAGMAMAIMVLTAVATAISTRLGQVMTIAMCAGVFLMGLLSNHFLGARAFLNRPVGEIRVVEPGDPANPAFARAGDTYKVILQQPPRPAFSAGDRFFYGDSPNGFPMAVPNHPPFEGDLSRPQDFMGPGTPPRVIITQAIGTEIIIRNVGERPLAVARPPARGDWVFAEPTRVQPLYLALWAAVPNMHFFWLVDAVTQNRPVPASHLLLMTLYGLSHISVFLTLGVILFQRRDVG